MKVLERYDNERDFKVLHQLVSIFSIDGKEQSYSGYTELDILSVSPTLSRIKINCRQLVVSKVLVKGVSSNSFFEVGYQLQDPLKCLAPPSESRRSPEFIYNAIATAVCSRDPDLGGGELSIKIPANCFDSSETCFKVAIHFKLPRAQTGFVRFPTHSSDSDPPFLLYTDVYGNSSRTWFPCVDSNKTVCTWKLEFSVPAGYTAVSCGDLSSSLTSTDGGVSKYVYHCAVPTSACRIGFVIGQFESMPDPVMNEVVYYHPVGMSTVVTHSCSCLTDMFDLYEDILAMRFPHSVYRLVFIEQAADKVLSFSAMTVLNVSLLHPETVIEQAFETRKSLALALAEQFFGCFIHPSACYDSWITVGLARYLSGIYERRTFGNNEYRYYLMQDLEHIITTEPCRRTSFPLYPFPLTRDPSLVLDSDAVDIKGTTYSSCHPHIVVPSQQTVVAKRAHLAVRHIESRIGQDMLLQVLTNIISMAWQMVGAKHDLWGNFSISTPTFFRMIATVAGKDLESSMDVWLCKEGVVRMFCTYNYNRKRNVLELDLRQEVGPGCIRYQGPLTVVLQELDGVFTHSVHVEDVVSHQEIPCSSRSRRGKKRKVPLSNGEETELDFSSSPDADNVVLWVRVDPELTLPMTVSIRQADYSWCYALKYERDVVYQIEAARALTEFPSSSTKTALIEEMSNNDCYYQVRIEAAKSLAKITAAISDIMKGSHPIVEWYQKNFGSRSCPDIPRYNDFSNFRLYMLQKGVLSALSCTVDTTNRCPGPILEFFQSLLFYNENRNNRYHDGYLRGCLIMAQCNACLSAVDKNAATLDTTAKSFLKDLIHNINLDRIIPSYRHVVTVNCLQALSAVIRTNQISSDLSFLINLTLPGIYEDVRVAVHSCLVVWYVQNRKVQELCAMLDSLETQSSYIRCSIASALVKHLPGSAAVASLAQALGDQLWTLLITTMSFDYRTRSLLMELYWLLYSGVEAAPSTVAHTSSLIDIVATDRRCSRSSPDLPQLATPSVATSLLPGNKIRLLIKIGGEEVESPREHKKKKHKRKHHKEKPGHSGYDSPKDDFS